MFADCLVIAYSSNTFSKYFAIAVFVRCPSPAPRTANTSRECSDVLESVVTSSSENMQWSQ